MTRDSLKKIRFKNELYKKFIQNKCAENFETFKSYRNKLVALLKRARSDYYMSHFSNCQKNALWKKINNMLSPYRRADVLREIYHNGKLLSGMALANAFNNFLVNQSQLPSSNTSINTATKYIKNNNCNSMFLSPTDRGEVFSSFIALKNSKCCDVDNLQIGPIKYVLDIISLPLTHIFNVILSSGIYPKKMQLAKVILIFKGGDTNELGNYRPISILSVFSKGIEKIIHTRLSGFISRNSILSDFQHGFRPNRSTETALLAQKELILHNFEKIYLLSVYTLTFQRHLI